MRHPVQKAIPLASRRRIVRRVQQIMHRTIMTPREWERFSVNQKIPIEVVEDRDSFFLKHYPKSMMSTYIRQKQQLESDSNRGDRTAKVKLKHLQRRQSFLFDEKGVSFFSEMIDGKPKLFMLVGPRAKQSNVVLALRQRLLQNESEYFAWASEPYSFKRMDTKTANYLAARARKHPERYWLAYYWIDPRTKKFMPVYLPRGTSIGY